jgi:hypothetical protein
MVWDVSDWMMKGEVAGLIRTRGDNGREDDQEAGTDVLMVGGDNGWKCARLLGKCARSGRKWRGLTGKMGHDRAEEDRI